jgi:hypothetical protein
MVNVVAHITAPPGWTKAGPYGPGYLLMRVVSPPEQSSPLIIRKAGPGPFDPQ